MMIPDFTVRNRYGSADLIPFLRRDAGNEVELLDWEKPAAALEFHARGWHPHRISRACGLSPETLQAVLSGRYRASAAVDRSIALADRSEVERERRIRRMAGRVRVDGSWYHPDAPHGSPGASSNWGCYCGPCRGAHAKRVRDYRRKEATA